MSGKYWNDKNRGNYSQENNASEKLLGHLESCGPTALASCIDCLGVAQATGYLQPEDYYTMLINDPTRLKSPDGYPANRYILNYPPMIKLVYPNLKAKIVWYGDDKAQQIHDALALPDTVLMLVMIDPGHYVSAQHYQDGMLYYADPWTDNYYNPAPTVKRAIRLDTLVRNLKLGFVQISL